MPALRIATFNLENLDDVPGAKPTLAERIRVLRPQLERLRADVLCLQEVHGQEVAGQPRALLALGQLLAGTRYAAYNVVTTLTAQGVPYDVRNLVVLSPFPTLTRTQLLNDLVPAPSYQRVTANPAQPAATPIRWERPILHVRLDLGAGRTLDMVNLHLKSRIPTDIDGQKVDTYTWRTAAGWAEGSFISGMKRVGQALEVRTLIDQIFDAAVAANGPPPWIVVCGDFNAEQEEVPLAAICGAVEDTGNVALHDRVMVPCENNIPTSSRYTLFHLGQGAMLDHVLVTRGLLQFFTHAEAHNEILPDESGAFRTDTKFPESDHAPVVAEFLLP